MTFFLLFLQIWRIDFSMDVFFENQGLCHIGENIFKNLDFHSQLTFRLVRKSWNNMFFKDGSKLNAAKNLRAFNPKKGGGVESAHRNFERSPPGLGQS